jgi:ribose 5-phosphate isomerase
MSITAMEAKGTELITHMQLPVEVTDAVLAQIQQQLPVQACANPQAREMFRRGGTYTYKIKDSSGEEFSTSVSSC